MTERINGNNPARDKAIHAIVRPQVAIGAYKDVAQGQLGTALTEGLQTFAVHWIQSGLPEDRVKELAQAYVETHTSSPIPIATAVVEASQELRRDLDAQKQNGKTEHIPQLPQEVVKLGVDRPEDEATARQKYYERRIRKDGERPVHTIEYQNGKHNGIPPQGDIVNFE